MIDEKDINWKINQLFGNSNEEDDEEGKENSIMENSFPTKPTIELPVYEKMEYVPKTDEEIEEQAGKQLDEYKSSAMQSYDLEFDNTKQQKEREKELKETEREENEKKVMSTYDEKSKKIDYDLIKRGMVNSSSSQLLKEKNEKQRQDAISAVASEYAQAIEKLDNDIQKADNKRLQAIAEFNISYALKFSNIVSKLKSERDEMVQKALEYNNKITKQEYADQINKEKTESDLYSEALDQYEQELDIQKKEQANKESDYEYKLYNVLRNQLAAMSKQEAYNALRNDPTYAEYLSSKYYLQLVYEFGR